MELFCFFVSLFNWSEFVWTVENKNNKRKKLTAKVNKELF